MPAQIPKSFVDSCGFDFHAAAEAYRDAMTAHRHTLGAAAPLPENGWVGAAVRRVPGKPPRYGPALPPTKVGPGRWRHEPRRVLDPGGPDEFVVDYEVVDDTPPPPPPLPLRERRSLLINRLGAMEAEEREAVIGPGKLRLLVLDAHAAREVPEADRTPDHQAALQRAGHVGAEHARIARRYAERMALVDDLDEAGCEALERELAG